MQKQQEIVFFLGTILLTLTAVNLKIAENYSFQILFIDVCQIMKSSNDFRAIVKNLVT